MVAGLQAVHPVRCDVRPRAGDPAGDQPDRARRRTPGRRSSSRVTGALAGGHRRRRAPGLPPPGSGDRALDLTTLAASRLRDHPAGEEPDRTVRGGGDLHGRAPEGPADAAVAVVAVGRHHGRRRRPSSPTVICSRISWLAIVVLFGGRYRRGRPLPACLPGRARGNGSVRAEQSREEEARAAGDRGAAADRPRTARRDRPPHRPDERPGRRRLPSAPRAARRRPSARSRWSAKAAGRSCRS